jgi:putative nucleotidyltransferase with HDIG domain
MAGKQFDPHIVRVFCEFEALARIRQGIKIGSSGARSSTPSVASDTGIPAFDEMLGKVETDPVLAACVLREANSAASVPTAKLSTACAALGVARLREITSEVGDYAGVGRANERLLEHSLRCAEAARLLAEQTGLINPEDAYTLGLLHDVGEILLRSLFPGETKDMEDLEENERIEREIAAFGVDHAQVGQWVLDACGVPRALTSAVQTHHDVTRINAPAALLLHLANAIAHADDPFKVAALDTISTERLYMLRLSRNDLFRIHACLETALDRRFTPVL